MTNEKLLYCTGVLLRHHLYTKTEQDLPYDENIQRAKDNLDMFLVIILLNMA